MFIRKTCNMNMDLIRFICTLKAWPCKPPTQNYKLKQKKKNNNERIPTVEKQEPKLGER